jgi:hypothetical protein
MRLRSTIRFLVLASLASALWAQSAAPPDVNRTLQTALNFGDDIQRAVRDLITTAGNPIYPLGWWLLAFITAKQLSQVFTKTLISIAEMHHAHVRFSGVVIVLFRMTVAAVILRYYNVPGLNFHNVWNSAGIELARAVNAKVLGDVLAGFADVQARVQQPGMGIHVLDDIVYMIILALLGISQLAMWIVTASGIVMQGLLVVVGPLFVPFYVDFKHDERFWRWLNDLIAKAMYPFAGACVGYVFGEMFLKFFANALNGDYSLGHLTVLIPALLTLVPTLVYVMIKLPAWVEKHFGDIGGLAQGASDATQGWVVRLAGKALSGGTR